MIINDNAASILIIALRISLAYIFQRPDLKADGDYLHVSSCKRSRQTRSA